MREGGLDLGEYAEGCGYIYFKHKADSSRLSCFLGEDDGNSGPCSPEALGTRQPHFFICCVGTSGCFLRHIISLRYTQQNISPAETTTGMPLIQ